MASPGEATVNDPHVGKKKKPPARYWQEPKEEGKDENKVGKDGEQTEQALQQKEQKIQKAKKRKQEEDQSDGKKFISGKLDPFPGPAPIPEDRVQKFKRKDKIKKKFNY